MAEKDGSKTGCQALNRARADAAFLNIPAISELISPCTAVLSVHRRLTDKINRFSLDSPNSVESLSDSLYRAEDRSRRASRRRPISSTSKAGYLGPPHRVPCQGVLVTLLHHQRVLTLCLSVVALGLSGCANRPMATRFARQPLRRANRRHLGIAI